jgi:hypothetical protein
MPKEKVLKEKQKMLPYYRGTIVCIVTQCYIYGYQFKHLLSQSQKNYDKKMSIQNRKKYWQVFVKTMIFSQKRLTKICRKLINFFTHSSSPVIRPPLLQ